MSDRQPPVEQHHHKAEGFTQPPANQAGTGIGGGLVGLAIGGLLGRRVGGVSGAVVGAVAGALVGKGTAQRVNRTVEAVVDSAKSVTDGVNHSVKNVGDAIKDTVEEVKPSVVGVVDAVKNIAVDAKPSVVGVVEAVKDTVEQVKPSVVATAESVNHSAKDLKDALNDTVNAIKPVVNDVVDAVKNIAVDANPSVVSAVKSTKTTVGEVKPSVITTPQSNNHSAKTVESKVDQVNLDSTQPSKLAEKPTSEPLPKSSPQNFPTSRQEHLSNNNNEMPEPPPQIVTPLQQSQPSQELDLKPIQARNLPQKPETAQQIKQPTHKLATAKIPIIAGILLSAVTITWSSWSGTLSPQETLLATNLPKFKLTLNSAPRITVDGWIFLGNLNNTSASKLGRKSLTKASQTTSSSLVPSVGSIVTVTAKQGVRLRKNFPQEPNFNYQEQKAIATLKAGEKLKILKVESLTPNTVQPVTKVWVAVSRCGKACN